MATFVTFPQSPRQPPSGRRRVVLAVVGTGLVLVAGVMALPSAAPDAEGRSVSAPASRGAAAAPSHPFTLPAQGGGSGGGGGGGGGSGSGRGAPRADTEESFEARLTHALGRLDVEKDQEIYRLLETYGAGFPPRSNDEMARFSVAALRLAKHEEAAVRRGAIAALGRLPGSELRDDPFSPALEDVDPAVRRQAVFARARHALAENWQSVARLASDEDSSVRAAAAQTLGDVKQTKARDLLVGLLEDPSDEVVDAAAAAFSRRLTEDPPQAVFLAAHSERPRVRLAATRVLGEAHASSCLRPLLALLDDRVWDIRREAVRQLTRFAGPDGETAASRIAAIAVEVVRLRSDRFEALQALAHTATAPDLPHLIDVATNDGDPVLRLAAARTLVARGETRAAAVLVALLTTETGPQCDFEDKKFVRTTAGATLRAITGIARPDEDVASWKKLAADLAKRVGDPDFSYSPEYLPERW